jgi:hypothetical protein
MAACVTRAWLTLGTLTMPLEDEDGRWFMTELDLGYPEVREVVNNRPDQDGVDDRTAFFGARAVSASVTAVAWGPAKIDDVASRFAPFMVPSARPVLHYVLDRPGAPERILTVRAANYGFVVDNPDRRDIHLQWIAADPIVRDPTVKTVTAWAGSSTGAGRAYNLTFPRTYPTGGGGGGTLGIAHPLGDLAVRPLLRIYGPVTAPRIFFSPSRGMFSMLSTMTISTGQYVEVDCAAHTAWLNGDHTQNLLSQVNWTDIGANGGWPLMPPGVDTYVQMLGSSTGAVTQVQVSWQDRYLS